MIRVRDAVTLARTKLKTRKIRTGITVGMSGILFGLMMAVSMLVAGVGDSAKRFGDHGLGGKYIMSAYPIANQQTDWNAIMQDPKVQARAEAVHAQLIKDKQAEAKRLGLIYDPRSETEPVEKMSDYKYLRTDTPAALQAIKEHVDTHATKSDEQLIKDALAPYKPTRYYQSRAMKAGSDFTLLKDGKEEFDKSKQQVNAIDYHDVMGNADDIGLAGLLLMDDGLTRSFLLPESKWTPKDSTIPVIITYSAAEKMLGLKSMKSGASADERLAHNNEIRSRINGHKIDYCYRNDTSRAKIDQTVAQQAEIKKNQGNKDYQMPSQIYGLPDASVCGPAVTTKDIRTAEEKRYEANQVVFDKKFGLYQEPVQAKITFQVVGLTVGYGAMMQRGMLEDIAMAMLGSSLGNEWVVPKSMYDKLPANKRYESILMPTTNKLTFESMMNTSVGSYYAEFADFNSARAAFKKFSCMTSSCEGLALALTQFGSSSVTVAEIKDLLRHGLMIAGAVVSAIAMIIMWGTIGRTIADSRRETAVFRAIGAKRSDISLIYLAYTVLLSLRVVVFTCVLGVVISLMIDYFTSPGFSVDARLMFGVTDETQRFSFIGIDWVELAAISGLVLLTGLISMIVPLIRNVRRNPIGDMRDE